MECVTCVCVWLGAVWVERGGELMRELGLGFTNPVGAVGWYYVCVSLDSLCRWPVQVSVYCA